MRSRQGIRHFICLARIVTYISRDKQEVAERHLLINRRWCSALWGQVDVELDLFMEVVRGLWSMVVYTMTFHPSIECWNFFTEAATARSSLLKVD